MMRADLMLRAALVALDEAGDPTRVRAGIEAARKAAPALKQMARPANAVKRIAWAASQLAMFANDPARAYSRLRELVAALFEPLATYRRAAAPAPEVAMQMKPGALIDALAPQPRVLAREVALVAKLDAKALLGDA